MIKQYLYIKKYEWNLVIIYNANSDLSIVAKELWLVKCPAKISFHALKVISRNNTGFCYTNTDLKATLICIAEVESAEEFVNTVVHELKHLQSHICSYYGISEKGEEAAYLIGDTFEELYKMLKYELYGRNKTVNRISSKN